MGLTGTNTAHITQLQKNALGRKTGSQVTCLQFVNGDLHKEKNQVQKKSQKGRKYQEKTL